MQAIFEQHYLNTIPLALVAVDRALCVAFANQAAEALFGVSVPHAQGKPLSALSGCGGELSALCERVFASCESVSLFGQELALPQGRRAVTLHVTPVISDHASGERLSAAQVLITVEKPDGLDRLAASEWKHEATRAAGVMAAMLAHEVKNPLSGIRGAAQLLKEEVTPEQQILADLICMETDRIRDLLAQVEVFTAGAPERRQPVNIHEVLQYVIQVAQTGVAQRIVFTERYDPSLPEVMGHRDLLVQLFLNLVKNAAEALAGRPEAAITVTTAYRGGYRLRIGEQKNKAALSLAVTIEDNGPGIPEAVRARLFEPFVSSREEGRGLGLAVVAKIASDLGAVVELDTQFDGGARFTVLLACCE